MTNPLATLTFSFDAPVFIEGFLFWHGGFSRQNISSFTLFADDNDNYGDGGTTQFAQSGSSASFTIEEIILDNNDPNQHTDQNRQEQFFFDPVRTQYVHLNIEDTHSDTALNVGEVAFVRVPFEFSPIPGIVFLVTVGGIKYFRNKGKGIKERGMMTVESE